MDEKTTLVIGASLKPERYSNIAIHRLLQYHFPVIAFGPREGSVASIKIENKWNPDWKIDTITLYINPILQKEYYSKIIDLKVTRVIFNPGTENEEFIQLLQNNGVKTEIACTLVLLSLNQY